QIGANQNNAQLSTGPSTPEGKSISSRNSVKHDLSGGFKVYPHEDQTAFDCLRHNLQNELSPSGEHQSFLVEEMAQARWKLARIRRLESVLVEVMITPADADPTHLPTPSSCPGCSPARRSFRCPAALCRLGRTLVSSCVPG